MFVEMKIIAFTKAMCQIFPIRIQVSQEYEVGFFFSNLSHLRPYNSD